jgi:phosphoribosylaminoimidazolecarboxamide formyltransferase/IMP cyclohydrolase
MLQHLVEIYNQKKTIFAIYNNNYIMNTTKTIQSALISVFSKEGLEPIVRKILKMLFCILQEEPKIL